MEETRKKKLIMVTLFYLILGNIIIPLIGYIYTGTIKGALIFYGGTFVFSFIFWPYFGFLLLNPIQLINFIRGKN